MSSVDARSSDSPRLHLVHLKVVWFVLSGLVIVPGLWSLFANGLNYGTDFAGGASIAFTPSKALPTGIAERGQLAADIARAAGLDAGAVKLIDMGDQHQILATLPIHDANLIDAEGERLRSLLEAQLGDRLGAVTQPKEDATFVGPTIGRELRRQAVYMLIFGLGAILIYLKVRYNLRMAVGAVAALAHDALILIGAMSLFRIEINSPFIAALLTVLGFSVHDSIIIFDRIRENMQSRSARHEPYADTVNFALWQTMSRSVNTVLTAIFVLVSLLLWGGDTIREFIVALLIGMVSGAYSSIFNASQIVVVWEEHLERKKGAAVGTVRSREGLRPLAGPSEARRRAEEQRRAERLAAAEAGASVAAADGGEGAELDAGTKPRAQDAKKARSQSVRKSKRRF